MIAITWIITMTTMCLIASGLIVSQHCIPFINKHLKKKTAVTLAVFCILGGLASCIFQMSSYPTWGGVLEVLRYAIMYAILISLVFATVIIVGRNFKRTAGNISDISKEIKSEYKEHKAQNTRKK